MSVVKGFVSEGKGGKEGILDVILIVCWEQVSRPGEEEQG
jgi:hypothetical protein